MFRHRFHSPDGNDLGQATYPDSVKLTERLTSDTLGASK